MSYVITKFKKDLNDENCCLGDVKTKLTEKDIKRIFGDESVVSTLEVTARTARAIQEVDKSLSFDLNLFDYQIFPEECSCIC